LVSATAGEGIAEGDGIGEGTSKPGLGDATGDVRPGLGADLVASAEALGVGEGLWP